MGQEREKKEINNEKEGMKRKKMNEKDPVKNVINPFHGARGNNKKKKGGSKR